MIRHIGGGYPAWQTIWGLALILILLLPLTAAASERQVDGSQALQAALAAAGPGDVLRLASGDYGTLVLSRNFDGQPLTIRAANAAKPPRFTSLNLSGAGGVVLQDLAFIWYAGPDDPENKRVSTIGKSHDITLRHLLFQGDVARHGRSDVRGRGLGYGLSIRDSQDITLENSEFRTWTRALIVGQSKDITLRGNELHTIRSDGVDFAQVNGVTIEGNHFHDFDRAPESGDHPDMVQFWTNKTTAPSTDIRIRDNLFNSGNGLFTQSIFMRNEEVDTGRAGREMFYKNVEITGNIIINAHLHGITVGETDGLLIASNTLVRNRLSAGAGGKPALWTPTIRVSVKSERVAILRNITPGVVGPNKRPDWKVAGNLIIQDNSPAKPGYYDTVFAAAILGDPSQLTSFAYRPGGPAAEGMVGAPGLQTDRIAARMGGEGLAVIQANRDTAYANRFHFDAGQALMTKGREPSWDFGDGSTASGIRVRHDFAQPGEYLVTLQTGPEPVERAKVRVVVADPRLLLLDPMRGLIGPDGPVAGGAGRGGVLRTGGNAPAVEVPRSVIAGMFGARNLTLDLELATTGGKAAAGEILRVHEALILGMTPQGQIMLSLFSGGRGKKPLVLRTHSSQSLNDGQSHRLVLQLADGMVTIRVDGQLAQRARVTGGLPSVNRSLILGGAFGKPGLPARITTLTLIAGAEISIE